MPTQYLNTIGTYTCRVIKPEAGWFGESKEKKTPFLRIPLEVDDPESDQHGNLIVCERYITESTIDRLTRDLVEVFGWNGDLVALDSGIDEEVPEGFAGKLCSIVTEVETYDGKERIHVKWLNPVDYKPRQLTAEKVKSLLAKFASRAKAVAKAAKTAPAPKPQPKVEAPF
ncbi:MAG: hypothetical protein ACFUZC_03485 [Chthoniobacteraceae bacterium]